MHNITKRIFDVFISFLLIILILPIMIIVALTILISTHGSFIFCHRRVGLNGKVFYLYKFTTMVPDAEKLKEKFTPEQKAEFESTFKLKDDPRVTGIGKILRKTSLDELPQLFNVLMGAMSIVGPRPVTCEEIALYDEDKETLLSVKPGITGLWQVSGRNDVSYEQRIQLDIEYVNKKSFLLDLKIILRTLKVLVSRSGAY